MARSEKMIIGSGSHQYEVIDLWGKLPEGMSFGTTHGVVEDAKGRIYIHHRGQKSVSIFDPDGQHIASWGETYSSGAHGMYLNREADGEYLYLGLTSQEIVAKTTLDGQELFRIPTPPRPDIYDNDQKRFIPTEVAVAANGDIYIADGYGQAWIHRYTKNAEYITSFGGFGRTDGKLDNVHGIKIDTRGPKERVLVADRGNNRLQYFTLEGEFISSVTAELRKPCTTIQWKDEIYIPDLFSRVSVFDRNDQLIVHLGDRPQCWTKPGWPNLAESEWEVGGFSSPHDLHVDKAGNIYVVEWMSSGVGKCTKLVRL